MTYRMTSRDVRDSKKEFKKIGYQIEMRVSIRTDLQVKHEES